MRTPEELDNFFKTFKEKKQKQKQRESEQKKKVVKEKQSQKKRVDKLKKELFVQQLINTHVKPFQKPPEPLKHITIINVGDFDEDNLYTFEELMNIEQLYPNETGRINWNFYNYLVNKTKQLCQSTQNKQWKKNT